MKKLRYRWCQFWLRQAFRRQMWGLACMCTTPEDRLRYYKNMTGIDYRIWQTFTLYWGDSVRKLNTRYYA